MTPEKFFTEQLRELQGDDSVRAFAIKCGVDAKSMGKYLKGEGGLTLRNLLKISKACGVTVDWLLSGENENPSIKQPATGDALLQLIIQWLINEYQGNPASQSLLMNELIKVDPSLKTFLAQRGKGPIKPKVFTEAKAVGQD